MEVSKVTLRSLKHLCMVLAIVLAPWVWIGGLAVAQTVPQVTVNVKTDGDRHIIVAETPLFRATIVPEWGGRIISWFDKRIDREVVYFQDGQGGLLDERGEFTMTRFTYTVVADRKRVSAEGTAQSELLIELDGMAYGDFNVRKRLRLYPGKPLIRVQYLLANRSQHDRALWVRNFIRPAGEEVSDATRWVLPTAEGVTTLAAKEVRAVGETPQAWAVLLDTERKAGVLATVELGLFEKFYFWLGSRQFPTFEWVFRTLPAGQSVEAWCYLVLLHEVEAVDEKTVAQLVPYGHGRVRQEPKFADIPGWRDLRPKFTPSERDQANGFALYTVRDGQAKAMTELAFDAPPGGADSQWVMVSALRDVAVEVSVSGALSERVSVWREEGEQRRLRPARRLELKQGDIVPLLLTLDGATMKVGESSDELRITSGQQGVQTLVLKAKVWDILLPDRSLLYWRGYGASSYLHTRGYKLERPDALDRLRKFFSDGKAIGQSVHEWGFLGNRLIPYVRLRETGELVADAAKKEPLLSSGRSPALDFSFLDPVANLALEFGLRYADMASPNPKHWGMAPIYRLAWGKDVAPDSDEARQAYRWFVSEWVRYVHERGYPTLFGKVMDEISPERLPAYLAYARSAKAAGLRVFTTIGGPPAQVERLLDAMAPVNDGWQVSLQSNLSFERLRSKLKPSDLVTYYRGPSKPYRLDYAQGRRSGWFAAARGYPGYAFWAYVHWQPTENIVFEEPDGALIRTPVWYGLRDGNADGNLLRLLQQLTARAEKAVTSLEQQRALAQARSTLRRACSLDPDALLPLVERDTSASRYLWFPDDVADEQFTQARRMVLESLKQLQHYFPPQTFTPDLWWGDVQIAARGQSQLQVVSIDQKVVQRLTDLWQDGLRRATVFAADSGAAPLSTQVVVFADRPNDEALRKFSLNRAVLGITEHYPATDHYLIASDSNMIAVVGGGERGAARGLRALLASMELRW